MTAADMRPSLDEYWRDLEPLLPGFSPEQQRAAVALYRELAKGRAVDAAQLWQALGISSVESHALLRRSSISDLIYPDDQGRVVGFGASRQNRCIIASRLTGAPYRHGARGTASSFPRSWDGRHVSRRLIRKTANSCA
jgi:hypothetical protein